ncbi:MAG TPA: amino acid adenylation domain-containing protein [Thermoanaerobaculia bacterium]|nr:amino acid adenylation domain-containing protein [Thermoanaerobaculia bacterium]
MAEAAAPSGALVALVSEVFPGAAALAPDEPLAGLGRDSLKSARLWLVLQRRFGVALPLEWLAGGPSLAALAERLEAAAEPGAAAPGLGGQPCDHPAPAAGPAAPLPLSALQQAYLLGRRSDLTADPVGCHLYRELEIDDLDLERLRRAWQHLLVRHEVLRAVVGPEGSLRVLPEPPAWQLAVNEGAADPQGAILAARARLAHVDYVPGEWPHFTIEVTLCAGRPSVVHLSLDALLTDGQGLEQLLAEWGEVYRDPAAPLPPLSGSLREAVATLAERRKASFEADLGFWSERLAELPPPPRLPRADPAPTPSRLLRRPLGGALGREDWRQLCRRAEQLGVTPTAFVLALFADLLSRRGDGAPFSLLLTTSLRPWLDAPPLGAAACVGCFASTLVHRVEEGSGATFEEAALERHRRLLAELEHAALGGVEVLRELRRRGAEVPELPVVFTSLLGSDSGDGAFPGRVRWALSQTSGVFLDHQVWEQDGELCYRWDVAEGIWAPGVVESLFAAFETALSAAARGLAAGSRPLNELQQAYYVARLTGQPAEGCQVYHRFDAPALDAPALDPGRLEGAWLAMVEAYEPLRTVVGRDGRARLLAGAPSRLRFAAFDLAAETAAEAHEALAREMTARPFPLERWPPFEVRISRVEGGPVSVHLALDLAVADGTSLHFLFREGLRLAADPEARPRPAQPEEALPQGAAAPAAEAHWRARFADLPPGPVLRERRPGAARGRTRLLARLPGWGRAKGWAAAQGLDLDALLLVPLLEALAPLASGPFTVPVVVWPPSDPHRAPGERTLLAWVSRDPAERSGRERAAAYQRQIRADAAAGPTGLAELRRHVMRQRRTRSFELPVVHTGLLDFGTLPLPAGVEAGPWLTATPDVSLDSIPVDHGDRLELAWDVVLEDFAPGQAQALFAAYRRGVESLIADPEAWAAGDRGPDLAHLEEPLRARLERWARAQPEAIALRGRWGWLSFGELEGRARDLAARLAALGVGPETVVGLRLRRGPDMVAAVFAVLGAGGAYLPIEPGWPAERARLILAEARAALLVGEAGGPGFELPPGCGYLGLDAADSATGLPPAAGAAPLHPLQTAYVIFTSGSTGKPKGVKVAHGSVAALLAWCQRHHPLAPGDLGLAVAALGFDLSVFDLLGLLGAGAGLYLADEEEQKDPALLLDVLLDQPISFWNSAPAVLAPLAPLLPGRVERQALRRVFLSGDYTPLGLPDALRRVFRRAEIVSLGGATEATVWSNSFLVGEIDPQWRSIPYGKPIDGARYRVLDAGLEPCPVGVEGDLYIGGGCLAVGYHHQPALTAARFVPDPFAPGPGERLYRTGDRAAWGADGNLVFLGRADHQVKVRGFRIELGEIEHRLRSHPAVAEALVVARDTPGGDRLLVAYLLPSGAAAGAGPATVEELRRHCAQALPDYMVPHRVAWLERFPATANGKLDRAALPWPLDEVRPTPPPARAAALALREEVAALFAGLLGASQLDPERDLFDQGASSFTIVQASDALHRRHGRRIPVSVLLTSPTAAGIAAFLAGEVDAPPLPDGALAAAAPLPRPEPVELLSAAERERFKAVAWNLRPAGPEARFLPLAAAPLAAEWHRWRATVRDFLDGPIPQADLARLLGLLRQVPQGTLYPSAGDTYAVQLYLHAKAGAVEGLAEGLYYYHPRRHALELLVERPAVDRHLHFLFNRPLYDRAAFQLFLVGERRGIEPLYGDDALRFLTLEAGYVGQLLMMGQAACGIGLCPVGSLAFTDLAGPLGLDAGQVFLQGFLGGRAAPRALVAPTGEQAPFSLPEPRSESRTRRPRREEIAIVGLAGRFPGAPDPDRLWANLSTGVCSLGPSPAERFGAGAAGLPAPAGGFLPDVDRFDSLLFRIAPAEAALLDPQIRLLLETAWECLENAGYSPASLGRAAPRVGVFVALMWQDYGRLGQEARDGEGVAPLTALAADAAHRLSHAFDFRGPSLAVDAACASSLAALHLAASSLRSGECDAALVAGVNLLVHPHHLGLLAAHGSLSPAPAALAFDPEASGWLPGEGCGAVLLRPAERAEAEGDTVHGLLEATGLGAAGGAHRFGAPDAAALAGSLAATLEAGGLSPDDVDYVECAAAGASLADAAELEALGTVFGTRASGRLPVGTVKPNLGHLESAAGMSQLVKVLLQLRHRRLAPTLASPRSHPLLDWERLPLELVTAARPWEPRGDRPLRALVNGVGANGGYGHVVVRSPRPRPPREAEGDARAEPPWILLSAAGRDRLDALAGRLRDHLAAALAGGTAPAVEDLAFTLRTGRTCLAHRLAFQAASPGQVVAALEAFLAGRTPPGLRLADTTGHPRRPLTASSERAAVEAWLAGDEVEEWPGGPRPGRRVPLPTYPFAGGRHWLTLPAAVPPGRPAPAADARRSQLEDRLREVWAEVSGIPLGELRADVPLEAYGLSSFLVARLNARLERDFGGLSRTLFYEHRDLAGVASALLARESGTVPPRPSEEPTPRAARPAREAEAIAVVGIAGRYPQAPDLEQLWQNLRAGRDAIGPLPPERRRPGWDAERMSGGYLAGVDRFDAPFFHISPRESERIDPQERLFLEVAWETLEDAGYSRERLRRRHGSRLGVFVGAMYNEYPFFGVERSLAGPAVDLGSTLAGIANRVSYLLDASGPSLTVDTMCSSSLTALHLAVESLRRGECEVALAGGVNLNLHANKFAQLERLGMAASDHRCRSFGAGGDGFVPGEGVGAVLLKPLSRARADGDRIHAVILSTAINHDGKTNGYTVPNPKAQAGVVAAALERSGVEPGAVSYLEAHGTGTELGDPVEWNGLMRAFGAEGPAPALPPGAIRLGSVKSNLGHLEAAAGIAGLTKVILQMRHGELVPSLHAERLNPNIDWARSPFTVQRRVEAWSPREGQPLVAGVSSFGAGGANAHLIVASPPRPELPAEEPRPRLVLLSAFDEERLRLLAGRLGRFLAARPPGLRLTDVAFTLAVGREPLRERLALVVDGLDLLAARLLAFAGGRAVEGVCHGRAPGPGGEPPGSSPEPFDLEGLARHWVAGGSLDAERLFGGPRTIVSLPSYPFAPLRCWPSDAPAQAEAGETRVELLVKTWEPEAEALQEAPPIRRPVPAAGSVLCLFQPAARPLAEELARLFAPADLVLVESEAGDDDEALPEDGALPVAPEALRGWIDLRDLAPGPGRAVPRLAALQRWLEARRGRESRLLHVTAGLQELPGAAPSLEGAVMAGLVRALAAEQPGLAARTVDLDVAPGSGPGEAVERAAAAILDEWGRDEALPETCWRGGRCHRPRLVPAAEPAGAAPPVLDPERVYLVTGGTGRLGGAVARWLVRRGARQLVLWGERDLPRGERPIVAELEALGAEVELWAGPLGDRSRLAGLLATLRAEGRAVGGVVHCAGRGSRAPAPWPRKSREEIAAVLAPKVEGLLALADALAGKPLAFFVLFSSVSATVPRLGAGVAEYAAANAFLDFFAGWAARRGRPEVRSIAWPVWRWEGPGAPAAAEGEEACAALGLGTLGEEEGLAALERVLSQGASHVVVCPRRAGFDARALLAVPERPRRRAPAPAPVPGGGGPVPAWLRGVFAETLGLAPERLDATATFGELGVESLLLAELVAKIEPWLGRPLDPTAFFDHPTLELLAAHLGVEGPAASPAPHPAPERAARAGAPEGERDDIAVIGLGCRLPGAEGPAALWQLLADGRSAVREVPGSRWPVARFYAPEPRPGASASKWGGFVDGIEDFDPELFGLGEAEATALDPAIRLMLETSLCCLRDAGWAEPALAGRAVGVFAGARMSGYRRRVARRHGTAGLGGDQSFIASRVAKHFDLHGPTLVVDGACASSLVAVHLACQSLRSGECELALAAGVEVLLDEEPYLELSAAKALSPRGRCAAFDLSADGLVPGEGCGVVLLKPLGRALADGDRIRAVIRGSAVNNDGRTLGLTTPNPAAQAEVVRRALAASGLSARQIGLLEAHGTGTPIGDPIELRALCDVFRESTDERGFCALGSIKSNLGHLLSAAGIAGLLKAVLALEHRQLPATLHCERPNPRFDFAASPFVPNTRLRPWEAPPGGGPRAAGVSAFGLGGVNAHLVVAEVARPRPAAELRAALPPPRFARRRLWLEREAEAPVAPASAPRPARVASLLRLEIPREARHG